MVIIIHWVWWSIVFSVISNRTTLKTLVKYFNCQKYRTMIPIKQLTHFHSQKVKLRFSESKFITGELKTNDTLHFLYGHTKVLKVRIVKCILETKIHKI